MKKICVVTTTRADYGILSNLIRKIDEDNDLELQLLVSGTHLSEKFGYTINEILKDGFSPNAQIEILEETELTAIKTMANALNKVGTYLSAIKPDLIVILGDRYEMAAVACASVILNIPIAHIQGGEITYGAYDDMFRHAITKMSHIHFASCEEYRRRIIQMGEQPNTVFTVGSLSVENLKQMSFFPKKELDDEFHVDLAKTLLATFHPVTMEDNYLEQFSQFLDALTQQNMFNVVLTGFNSDGNFHDMSDMLASKLVDNHRIKIVNSLGYQKYQSFMKYCAGVIGNSSSGILEAPSFKVGTVNVGTRQQGRIQADSVINCKAEKDEIIRAIEKLSSEEFQKKLKFTINPYEKNHTAQTVIEEIKNLLSKPFGAKIFFDFV